MVKLLGVYLGVDTQQLSLIGTKYREWIGYATQVYLSNSEKLFDTFSIHNIVQFINVCRISRTSLLYNNQYSPA